MAGIKCNFILAGLQNYDMQNHYFSKFNIAFTGFEKRIQQQLESFLVEKLNTFESAEVVNENCNPDLLIHFYSVDNVNEAKVHNSNRSNANNERILYVGEFNDFEDFLLCIRTGCYGCISASNILTEIHFALMCVLQNKIYVSPAFATSINVYFKNSYHKNYYTDLFTNREHKLIKYLTTGALYKEIAWKMEISENTVRSHIRNIYSKLKVHSKTKLTQKILKNNLITSRFYFLSDYIACLCY